MENKTYTQAELQTMVTSEYFEKRKIAAEHGVGLETLYNDESWRVREAVALKGYRLEEFLQDKTWLVRKVAIKKLKETLVVESTDIDDRLVPGEESQAFVGKYIYPKYELIRFIDGAFESENMIIYNNAVKQVQNLMVSLIAHEDPHVRAEVAKLNIGLDILIEDPAPIVRIEVARRRYRLDLLVNDPDLSVRIAVAEQGYAMNGMTDQL